MFKLGRRSGARIGSALGVGVILAFGLGSNIRPAQAATTQTSHTTVTSSGTPSASGDAVTFTAVIVPTAPAPPPIVAAVMPTGTVLFKDGATTLGTAPVTAGSPSPNGTASLTTTFLAAGTHNITGTYSGDAVTAGSAGSVAQMVTFGPASSITVTVSPATVVANGVQTAVATATVTDASGNPRPGDIVTFSTSGDVTFAPTVDHGNGQYTSVVTSSVTTGLENINATDTTAGNQISLGAGAPGTAAWVADDAPGDTDGQAIRLTTGTIGVGYSFGSLVGVPTTAPSTPPSYSYKSDVANSSGGSPRLSIRWQDATNTTVGTMVLSPDTNGPLLSTTWTVFSGAGNVWDVTGAVPGPCTGPNTAGQSYASLVTCYTTGGDHVSAAFIVNDSQVGLNYDDIAYGAGNLALITQQNGGSITSAVPAVLHEIAGPVTFVAVTPATSTLPTDGTTTELFTAHVTDVNGHPVAGDPVVFASNGDITFGSAPNTDVNGNTFATATAGTIVGPAPSETVTATDTATGAAGTAQIFELAGPATKVVASATPTSIRANGTDTSAVTATVEDVHGNPVLVAGTSLAFVTTKGAFATPTALTNTHGVAMDTLTASHTAGPDNITVTDTSVLTATAGTATVTETGLVNSVVVLLHSHALRANGTAHTTATATVTDSLGNPLSGIVITWTSSPNSTTTPVGGVTFEDPAGLATTTSTTNGSGVASIIVVAGTHASASGTKTTVTATDLASGGTGFDRERLLGSSFSHSLVVSPASVAEGAQSSAVANVVDTAGNPVQGEQVDFANDGSAGSPTFATAFAVTDALGNATDAITAGNTVGTKTVSATDSATSGTADANTDTLAQTATLGQTLAAATNASFVHAAYITMLGHGDTAGEAYWVSQINAGLPRSSFASVLANTPEYRNNVISGSGINDFYQLYLDRAGDAQGIQYWVNRMAGIGGSKLTFEQVRLQFVGSPEYFSSPAVGNNDRGTAIEALYQDLLNRPSDAAGKAYWLANFDASKISAQFLFSSEGRSVLVDTLYHQILNRSAAGDPGLAFWTNQLLNGASDENIIASILGSDEYFSTH